MQVVACTHKMDDLQKRHNGSNDDLRRQGLDSGEAFGLEGPYPKQGQDDVGSGLELERSLEQVAAREAWLNEQSQLPVENWLTGSDSTDFSATKGTHFQETPESATRPRALLVIDARSNQWEPLSTHLPENTDLLLIDEHQSGLEQVESSVRFAQTNGISYETVALVASRAAGDEVCLGSDTFKDEEVGLAAKQLAELDSDLFSEVRLRLFSDSAIPAGNKLDSISNSDSPNAVTTSVGNSASELFIQARLTLRTALVSGAVEKAVNSAFDEVNRHSISKKLNQFLDGKIKPEINWAIFDDVNIQGAFIASNNTILISEKYRDSDDVQSIVLEEIGHWLEADLIVDSQGDEGEAFSTKILNTDKAESGVEDCAILSIDGKEYFAELSSTEISGSTSIEDNWQVEEIFFNYERKFIGIDFSSPIKQISQADFRQLIDNGEFAIQIDGLTIDNSHINYATIPDPEFLQPGSDNSDIQDVIYDFDDQSGSYYLDIVFDTHLSGTSGASIDSDAFSISSDSPDISLPNVVSAFYVESYSNLGLRLVLDNMLSAGSQENLSITYTGSLDLRIKDEEQYFGQPLNDLGDEILGGFNIPIPGFNESSLNYLNLEIDQLVSSDAEGWMDIQLNDSVTWNNDSEVKVAYSGNSLIIAGTEQPIEGFDLFADYESENDSSDSDFYDSFPARSTSGWSESSGQSITIEFDQSIALDNGDDLFSLINNNSLNVYIDGEQLTSTDISNIYFGNPSYDASGGMTDASMYDPAGSGMTDASMYDPRHDGCIDVRPLGDGWLTDASMYDPMGDAMDGSGMTRCVFVYDGGDVAA